MLCFWANLKASWSLEVYRDVLTRQRVGYTSTSTTNWWMTFVHKHSLIIHPWKRYFAFPSSLFLHHDTYLFLQSELIPHMSNKDKCIDLKHKKKHYQVKSFSCMIWFDSVVINAKRSKQMLQLLSFVYRPLLFKTQKLSSCVETMAVYSRWQSCAGISISAGKYNRLLHVARQNLLADKPRDSGQLLGSQFTYVTLENKVVIVKGPHGGGVSLCTHPAWNQHSFKRQVLKWHMLRLLCQ